MSKAWGISCGNECLNVVEYFVDLDNGCLKVGGYLMDLGNDEENNFVLGFSK